LLFGDPTYVIHDINYGIHLFPMPISLVCCSELVFPLLLEALIHPCSHKESSPLSSCQASYAFSYSPPFFSISAYGDPDNVGQDIKAGAEAMSISTNSIAQGDTVRELAATSLILRKRINLTRRWNSHSQVWFWTSDTIVINLTMAKTTTPTLSLTPQASSASVAVVVTAQRA